jgi:hypothetical protein
MHFVGTVTEPQTTDGRMPFANHQFSPTLPPSPSVLSSTINVVAKLAGSQVSNTSVVIPYCAELDDVLVHLHFQSGADGESWPFNLELTLVDPMGKGLAFGGVDSSVGKASVVTEWPDEWMTHRNGSYAVQMSVKDAGLAGEGQWMVYVMNSYSVAGLVSYDLSVTLQFDSDSWNNGSCAHLAAPSPRPTVSTVDVADRIRESSRRGLVSHEAAFRQVMLGVNTTAASGSLVYLHDLVLVDEFDQSGLLDSLVLSLDAMEGNVSTRGTNAWLLDVIVTAPNGLVAQVSHFPALQHAPDEWWVRSRLAGWTGSARRTASTRAGCIVLYDAVYPASCDDVCADGRILGSAGCPRRTG